MTYSETNDIELLSGLRATVGIVHGTDGRVHVRAWFERPPKSATEAKTASIALAEWAAGWIREQSARTNDG